MLRKGKVETTTSWLSIFTLVEASWEPSLNGVDIRPYLNGPSPKLTSIGFPYENYGYSYGSHYY